MTSTNSPKNLECFYFIFDRDRVATPSNMLTMILGIHTTEKFVSDSLEKDSLKSLTGNGETSDNTSSMESDNNNILNDDIIKVQL